MKKIIRKNTFETNSSSTHAICIATDSPLSFPDFVEFEIGEFGWECKTYYLFINKASYLYTAILCCIEDKEKSYVPVEEWDEIKWIRDVLASHGIASEFEEPEYSRSEDNGWFYLNSGYIDHDYELKDWLKDILSDEDRLLNYLFTEDSYVETGNDNDEYDVGIKVNYPHEEYYKWN